MIVILKRKRVFAQPDLDSKAGTAEMLDKPIFIAGVAAFQPYGTIAADLAQAAGPFPALLGLIVAVIPVNLLPLAVQRYGRIRRRFQRKGRQRGRFRLRQRSGTRVIPGDGERLPRLCTSSSQWAGN